MTPWPKHPLIYEINTWVWLQELSQKHNEPLTLANMPAQAWDAIAELYVDAVWLMGVWERSPAGVAIANQNPPLLEEFRHALPDYREADNVGSPYCVRRYVVDERLGGVGALAEARAQLAARGLKLILDFVPNHAAPDHPWVGDHPEYFIQGDIDDAASDPGSFLETGGRVLARGRDPFFPAWPDVLQLNAFQPGFRRAAIATLSDIASQCDGVRCDMAMLLIDSIFERTWGQRAGARPATEYWVEVISAVRQSHPDFLFIAEAYWDTEWELQQQGFDYCYDKRLYDRLKHDAAESVQRHLRADLAYQEKLVRFTENHDEPRALATFAPAKARAAAVVAATLPGAKLFHEGQFEGRRVRVPVFLGRRPIESPDPSLQAFYRTLLKAASSEALRADDGRWRLCDLTGWPDNASCQNLVAWCWRSARERSLIVVNLSASHAQGLVRLPWEDLRGAAWRLTDLLSGSEYERDGDELDARGLYVDLPAWGCHVFRLTPRRGSSPAH